MGEHWSDKIILNDEHYFYYPNRSAADRGHYKRKNDPFFRAF